MPTETKPCGCCCATGKLCYQEWYTTWTCSTETWAEPVSDNKVCLSPGGALTSWTKQNENATNCQYKIHVPMNKCCSVNGDCSSEPDTATPAAPTDPPDDCCCCTDNKRCYATFVVSYNCDGETWSTVTLKERVCKSETSALTRLGWTPVGADATSTICVWEIDVPCEACNCCALDGDCSECELPETPTHPPSPGTCCICPCGDDHDPPLSCCGYENDSPDDFTVDFDLSASTIPANWNFSTLPNGDGKYFVAKLGGSVGMVSFTRVGDSCNYVGTSSTLKVLRGYCDDPPIDPAEPKCDPDEDVTTYPLEITVTLGAGGPTIVSAWIGADSPELPTDIAVIFAGVTASNFRKCCKSFTMTHDTATTPWTSVGGGDSTWIMCGGDPL